MIKKKKELEWDNNVVELCKYQGFGLDWPSPNLKSLEFLEEAGYLWISQPLLSSVCLFLAGLLFSFKMQKRNQSAEKVESCSLCCCDM